MRFGVDLAIQTEERSEAWCLCVDSILIDLSRRECQLKAQVNGRFEMSFGTFEERVAELVCGECWGR